VALTEETMARFQTRYPCSVRGPLLFVLVAMAMSTRPASCDPPAERYVFVENTDRWVGVIRGEWRLIGKLDKNGDFVHEHKLKKVQGSSRGIPPHTILNGGQTPRRVYEFRSGMLIPGELRADGNFVPEAGGKIIPFADYKYALGATPVWNLPGVFEPERPADKKK
jgi:hypothetical protein